MNPVRALLQSIILATALSATVSAQEPTTPATPAPAVSQATPSSTTSSTVSEMAKDVRESRKERQKNKLIYWGIGLAVVFIIRVVSRKKQA